MAVLSVLSMLFDVKLDGSLCGAGLSDAGDATATVGTGGLPGDRALFEKADRRGEETDPEADPGPCRWRGSASAGLCAK